MSRIAVSITARQRGHSHRTRRNECTAITDRTSFRHVANQTDSCFPRHGWLEKVLKFRKRRNAVKDDTGPHDLESRVVEGKRAGALQDVRFVIARNRGAQLLDNLTEPNQLIARVGG